MNRIIEVDRRGACALIEAGVSFEQLAAHLSERDLPLWLDADANGAHAVAGSIASRQWGLTPYGDHQAALCGLEAVLANGAVLRTGMGALPGSDSWSRYKAGFGAALDGLFSRAHFGVVTKLGVWLLPAPRRFLPFALALPDLATVARRVDALRPLLLDGTISGRVLIASRASDSALLTKVDSRAGNDNAAPWRLYGALYGLPETVEIHTQAVEQALGAALEAGQGAVWKMRLTQLRGESLYGDPSGTETGHQSFSVLAPAAGTDALALHHGVLTRLSEFAPRLEFRLAPRLLALDVELSATASDEADVRNAALAAVKDLVKAGYGLRHASPALDATLSARHTPAGLRHLYNGLHTALDPFAILATRGKFKAGKA